MVSTPLLLHIVATKGSSEITVSLNTHAMGILEMQLDDDDDNNCKGNRET